ncbi:peroxisomal membrane protein pex14 [Rhizoclosmatium sp. JEL0117]|nr:peroxisomal membrane protein pex14 [Rhizoclosmatium sp. JEL0117]
MSTPPTNPTIRLESVALAVKFLVDPKVSSAPLAKRISFLESKGLTSAEIEAALKEASSSSMASFEPSLPPRPNQLQLELAQSSSSVSQSAISQQQKQPRDWRDLLLAVIGAAGFGVGAWHLATTYILPNLSWPVSQQHKEEQEKLNSSIAAISSALESATKQIQDQTEKLQSVLDASVLEQERSAEEVRLLREELESLKDSLPTLIEKKNASEGPSITDLQSEIKSLKNLLLNRKAFPPLPAVSPIPPPLAYQSTSSSSPPKVNGTLSQNGSNSFGDANADSSNSVDAFLGKFTAGKPAIPAWQLAAASSSSSSSNTTSVSPKKPTPSTLNNVSGYSIQGQSLSESGDGDDEGAESNDL